MHSKTLFNALLIIVKEIKVSTMMKTNQNCNAYVSFVVVVATMVVL